MPNTEERAYWNARRALCVDSPFIVSLTMTQITLSGDPYRTAAEWHRRSSAVKTLVNEGLVESHVTSHSGRVYQKRHFRARN